MLDRLHKFLDHPIVNLLLGIYFVVTAFGDILMDLPQEEAVYLPSAVHGIFAIGVLIILRSLTELIVNLQEGVGELEKFRDSAPLLYFRNIIYSRYFIVIVAIFITLSGITDASEFFLESDYSGASSGLMLVVIGLSMLAYVFLAIFESEEYLKDNMFKNQRFLKNPRILLLKLIVGIFIVAVGIYEEMYFFEEFEGSPVHRSVITWYIVVTLKNIIRGAKILFRSESDKCSKES
ncbi:hypothetical protein [Shewanella sp. HL-SH2]|uniref:hypothetical protein n=1 Tax=Shewanella sp. HL-SH2 TaxID=3436238 RepID=UPI003EBBF69A